MAFRKTVLLFVLLIVIGYLIAAFKVVNFGNKPFNGTAEAAVVLGAAAWGNRPSPVYRERIKEAILLYHLGRVRWIIFTGGTPEYGYLSEAEVGRLFALKHGVPFNAILVDTESRSTWTNLVRAKSLMKTANIRSAILVSDPLHMCRATTMAIDIGLMAQPVPTTSSRFQSFQTWGFFLWRETWLYLAYIAIRYPS
jgi:uncharacterized SAM-binding protein YcdF (DUF218 family)